MQHCSLSLGGSCAIDGLDHSIHTLSSRIAIPVNVQWAVYGCAWKPDDDFSPLSPRMDCAFLRVEDFILEHPELLSSLESAGRKTKAMTKSARQADVAARRAAKMAKKQGSDVSDSSAQPFVPASSSSSTKLKEIFGAHISGLTLGQLRPVMSDVLSKLVSTSLGLSGCEQHGDASSAAPTQREGRQEHYVQFLPPSPFVTKDDHRMAVILDQIEHAVQLCAQACSVVSLPVVLQNTKAGIQVGLSKSKAAVPGVGEGRYTFQVTSLLPEAEWQACFVLPASSSCRRAPLHTLAGATTVKTSAEMFANLPERLSESQWFDAFGAVAAHSPYTELFWQATARSIFQLLHEKLVTTQKLCVLDCDNTLWEGAVGELGVDGVVFSDRCLQVQRVAKHMQQAGILLAVCSKNSLEDVRAVFQRRSGEMLLSSADIVHWAVSWQAKSIGIASTVEALCVGLDSCIFIDDNPVEIAEVNAVLGDGTGGLTGILLPAGRDWGKFLRAHWLVQTAVTLKKNQTAEDSNRTLLYQQNSARHAALQSATTFSAFLASLNLKIEVDVNNMEKSVRVAQLTERTNQFNTCKHIIKPDQLHAMIESGECCVLSTTVTDRFGCYGLVGAVIMDSAPTVPTSAQRDEQAISTLEPTGDPGNCQASSAGISIERFGRRAVRVAASPPVAQSALHVRHFMMSCRILHRGVEHSLLRHAAELAKAAGASLLAVRWRPSERNEPAARFFFGSLQQKILFVRDHESIGQMDQAQAAEVPACASDRQPASNPRSQKTDLLSKPPAGWIYISVQDALGVRLTSEDANVEEVFGSQSDDARQAAKARTQAAELAAAGAGGEGPDEDAAQMPLADAPNSTTLAVAGSTGIKLQWDVYQQLALHNFPCKGAETARSAPLASSLEVDEEAVTAAAQAAIDTTMAQFSSASAQSMIQAPEAVAAFKAKLLLEKQAQYRRKMRLQAKVIQEERLKKKQEGSS